MSTDTGTLFYKAPEIFLRPVYNETVDLWACGCILFKILTNKLPFTNP